MEPIDIDQALSRFSEPWSPRIIAQLNDYHIKLAKLEGEFVWHSHPETDEVFYVLEGSMVEQLRQGDVELKAGLRLADGADEGAAGRQPQSAHWTAHQMAPPDSNV